MGYNKNKHEKLKFKFQGSNDINNNYSQAYQDMFVLTMLNGKKNGIFLEIGASNPIELSNTYLLESKFNWSGISIDISEVNTFKSSRNCTYIIQDALTIDYCNLLLNNNISNQIDYLSLDIEPQAQTLKCLELLPLEKYRFSVVTYETDYYTNRGPISDSVRKRSRDIFKSYGYKLIAGNISNTGGSGLNPFEDWYVDPLVIDVDLINKVIQEDDDDKFFESFMLKNN